MYNLLSAGNRYAREGFELASTLAQGKPVIAFVPTVDKGYAKRLFNELKEVNQKRPIEELLLEQLQIFEPKAAWSDKNVRAWADKPTSIRMEDGIARLQNAIRTHYEKRADTLKNTHPLGVQVHLETGVANGVLVVRSVADCARFVRRIITKNMRFSSRKPMRQFLSEKKFRIVFFELPQPISCLLIRSGTSIFSPSECRNRRCQRTTYGKATAHMI